MQLYDVEYLKGVYQYENLDTKFWYEVEGQK
jgi:hypothetical protein